MIEEPIIKIIMLILIICLTIIFFYVDLNIIERICEKDNKKREKQKKEAIKHCGLYFYTLSTLFENFLVAGIIVFFISFIYLSIIEFPKTTFKIVLTLLSITIGVLICSFKYKKYTNKKQTK